MNSPLNSVLLVISWSWRQRHRFFKFGLVGVSGIVINQAFLWLCQEHVFSDIENLSLRLNRHGQVEAKREVFDTRKHMLLTEP